MNSGEKILTILENELHGFGKDSMEEAKRFIEFNKATELGDFY